jgi:hypothetical protein
VTSSPRHWMRSETGSSYICQIECLFQPFVKLFYVEWKPLKLIINSNQINPDLPSPKYLPIKLFIKEDF